MPAVCLNSSWGNPYSCIPRVICATANVQVFYLLKEVLSLRYSLKQVCVTNQFLVSQHRMFLIFFRKSLTFPFCAASYSAKA